MNLENVQPGDTLIWNGNRDQRITTVDRVTKTQIITDYGRYRKSDGGAVGPQLAFGNNSLSIPELDEVEKVHEQLLHKKLVGRVNDACQLHCLRKLSLETLQQLNEILL